MAHGGDTMKQDWMTRDGLKMYYELHGSGDPLVLIAGLASDSQSWAPILPALAERFQVVVFDNRGAGRTEPMDAPLNITQMADDVTALLDTLNIPQAHLLGHSMGGMIALECAARRPDRIRKLILASTTAKPAERDCVLLRNWAASQHHGMPPRLWFENLFFWIFPERFFQHPADVQAALDFSVNYPWPQTPDAFERQVETIAAFDIRDRLKSIHIPTLALHGERDMLFPPERVLPELTAISGLKMTIIPGAAHAIALDAPELFVRAVCSFLGA